MVRKTLVLATVALVALASFAAEAPRQVKQYTIEQFLNTTSVGGASFSPDERDVLFSSNKTGFFNVYTVPAAGGTPKQLTKSENESYFSIGYLPTDNRVLYSYDKGGNEQNHIYLLEKDGRERDLTPGEKLKANFAGWTHDNNGFYFSTNERDPKMFDLYRMDIATFKPTLLMKNENAFADMVVSPDENWVAVMKPYTDHDSDVFLYNTATKELKNITESPAEVRNEAAAFDPRTGELVLITNDGSEFMYAVRYDPKTGKRTPLERAEWDVAFVEFSHKGKYRVVGINQDARTVIKVYDNATNKPVALPSLGKGEIRGVEIARGEGKMAFYLTGDQFPSDLHVYDFATKKVTRLTNSLNPEINQADLVESQIVRYKARDGMEIPALLYKPHQAGPNAKVAALVDVHGGPGGQSRTGYSALTQFLVNHGYAVLKVNNRGSSGYGKTFYAADDGKHGKEPLWDCIDGKDYLAKLPYIDGDKIGIIGGSYGGYMVLAALAFEPEEFRAGVDIFGVSNWVRTLQSIPPYWEAIRKGFIKEIGDPDKDADKLKAISPLFHADKIKRPLIVLQGANDPRVIKPESDEIVEAVKKNGGVVEYIVFDNEGHGFTKKPNQIKGYQAILEFLNQHLKGVAAKQTAAK